MNNTIEKTRRQAGTINILDLGDDNGIMYLKSSLSGGTSNGALIVRFDTPDSSFTSPSFERSIVEIVEESGRIIAVEGISVGKSTREKLETAFRNNRLSQAFQV